MLKISVISLFLILMLSLQAFAAGNVIGIARHDENMRSYLKPGIKLQEKKDYYGYPITVRTFFTGIFEPREKDLEFIEKIKSYGQTPSMTLELRSWAQMLKSPSKVKAEKKRIDSIYGAGYYDELMEDIDYETVLDGVIAGNFDPLLKDVARDLSSVGPINLRIFHEPFWFPWKMHSQEDAAKFVEAVRHVADIFKENGADNVKIVITFDISGFNVETAILEEILPDGIVDVIEIDGYNDAWRRGLWKKDPTIEEMFGPKVRRINAALKALPPDKKRPLFLIGETAFDGTGELSKKEMYMDLVEFVKDNDLDGIVFLDENNGPKTEGSWYVDWTMEKSWAPEVLGSMKK